MLVDADPYGGAVAQQLGILDEVSGLLVRGPAGRRRASSTSGSPRCSRAVGEHLAVVTGLPRADRWVEVRAGAGRAPARAGARRTAHVVVDTGFSLEDDPARDFGGAARRATR